MKMRPLALSWPRIWLASPPTMRLSATAFAPGCRNCTSSLTPMSKPCQLMMALFESWLMLVVRPDCEMAASPAATWPPSGAARRLGATNKRMLMISVRMMFPF
jgi:hypothetical protein